MTKIQARYVKKNVFIIKVPLDIASSLNWKEEENLFLHKDLKDKFIYVNKLDDNIKLKIADIEMIKKIIQNKTKNNALYLHNCIIISRKKILEYNNLDIGDKVYITKLDNETLCINGIESSYNGEYTEITEKEDFFISYSIIIPGEIIDMMNWNSEYYLHWEKENEVKAIVTGVKMSDVCKPVKKGYDTEIQTKKRRFDDKNKKQEEETKVQTIGFAATIPKSLMDDMNWKKGDRLIWIPLENNKNSVKVSKIPKN